jgi:hypothetical protein
MAGEETCYDATYHQAGNECSSTYEGRHVNIVENLLVHPAHADGLVDKGDPVVVQNLVGVALGSANSDEDHIVVDTEGVWYLTVTAAKGLGDIHVGQMLFIDPVTAVISDDWEDTPFGHALAPIDFGDAKVIAVKVHAFQWLFPWWFFM